MKCAASFMKIIWKFELNEYEQIWQLYNHQLFFQYGLGNMVKY